MEGVGVFSGIVSVGSGNIEGVGDTVASEMGVFTVVGIGVGVRIDVGVGVGVSVMLELVTMEFVVCGRFMLEIAIAPIKLPTITLPIINAGFCQIC